MLASRMGRPLAVAIVGGPMGWLSVADCAASYRFGWLIGTVTGLFACLVITVLIATAAAQRSDRPRALNMTIRKASQWILTCAPIALLAVWGWSGYWARDHLSCFAITVSAGAASVIAPIMLLLMFASARHVGRASPR